MKNKILVFVRDRDEVNEKLKRLRLPDSEYFFHSEYDLENKIDQIDIFLGVPLIAKKYLESAKNLKWFQSTFAGIDSLIHPNLRKDYLLTNVKDVYGNVMAEYVLAYILMFEKEILDYVNLQQKKEWNQHSFSSVAGKSVGILGTGSIGKVIASKLNMLGFKVSGLNTSGKSVKGFSKVDSFDNITSFVDQVDYLVNVLPATSLTYNLVNQDLFQIMKKDSVFINIGRGSTVNESDLVKALNMGEIKAGVLDVFKEEPLKAQSELWDVPNLYITPHVSGYLISDEIFKVFESNYNKFINGNNLDYLIDFEKGY